MDLKATMDRIYEEASPEERARVILRLLGIEEDDARVTAIGALIRSYGDTLVSAQRERDAQYLEGRAEHMDQGEPGSPARWIARIFRDEAQAIRAQR